MSLQYICRANDKLYKLIIKELSEQIPKRYDDGTKTFAELDDWKNEELPRLLKKRFTSSHDKFTYITKAELVNLMDWKLAKGTFRPSLPKLIKSNNEETVKEVTQRGFQNILSYLKELPKHFWIEATEDELQNYSKVIRSTFKILCELKGVGPATASLLLSCLCSIFPRLAPPYFSDESFMYYVFDEANADHTKKIKYSVKEYADELLPVYYDLLKEANSELTPAVLEKGAWALKTYDLHQDDTLVNVENPFEGDVKSESWRKFEKPKKSVKTHVEDEKHLSKKTVPKKATKRKLSEKEDVMHEKKDDKKRTKKESLKKDEAKKDEGKKKDAKKKGTKKLRS